MRRTTEATSVDCDLPERSVVLAGPACSGKSTVARLLADSCGAQLATARSALEVASGAASLTRAQLVEVGERLEREHGGRWLVEAVNATARGATVVDAARTVAQLAALKRWRTSALTVFLDAAVDVRRRRFEARAPGGDMSFDELAASPVEREARELGPYCDLRFDSSELSSPMIAAEIVAAFDGG